MSCRRWTTRVFTLLLLATAPGYAAESSVLIQASPPVRATLGSSLVGYGTLAPGAGRTLNVTTAHAAVVNRLGVVIGSRVKRGDFLAELATDPTVTQGYAQARSAVDLARGEAARLERLLVERLATQSQVAASRKALADAEAVLKAQERLGAGQTVAGMTAPAAGVVMAVPSSPGDRLAAGAVVVQIAQGGALRVNLGIEPGDSARIRAGMRVKLTPLFGSMEPFEGRVEQVQGIVNPQTQLVDVLVAIDGSPRAGTLFGLRLRGDIAIDAREVWAVPRLAVLRDTVGAYVFQVHAGRARRVAVETGVVSGDLTAIQGDFDPRAPVVNVGNYELRDGMAVREAGR